MKKNYNKTLVLHERQKYHRYENSFLHFYQFYFRFNSFLFSVLLICSFFSFYPCKEIICVTTNTHIHIYIYFLTSWYFPFFNVLIRLWYRFTVSATGKSSLPHFFHRIKTNSNFTPDYLERLWRFYSIFCADLL